MITASPEQLTQAWSKLQALVPVTAIHTEQQYDHAIAALNMLVDTVGMDEQHPLTNLLDTLGTLIQVYEDQHETASAPSNTAILEFLMSEHDLAPSDLTELGDLSTVNEILAGKQPLTKPQHHALARRFGVTPDTFVSP